MGKPAEAQQQAQMANMQANLQGYASLPAPMILSVWLRDAQDFHPYGTLNRLTVADAEKAPNYAGIRPTLKGLALTFDKWGIIARYSDKTGEARTFLIPMAQVLKVELAE